MNDVSVCEFDWLGVEAGTSVPAEGFHAVPKDVFDWLDDECRRASNARSPWLKSGYRHGRRLVQVTSFVGVIRAPNGFQIEVLPKVGKVIGGGIAEARKMLVDMLCCLQQFRHIRTDNAKLLAARMPLLEIFLSEFLQSVEHVVKRGLRSSYSSRQDNLSALRGKLLIAQHLRLNRHRVDRFFAEHEEFRADRPENRLIHAALRKVLMLSSSQQNQKLGQELRFVFAEVPPSDQPQLDFSRIRLERGMGYYADALAWARLILQDLAPVTGVGKNEAPSLLFPMQDVFEAFVAKHLQRQLGHQFSVETQVRNQHLVVHRQKNWFRLQPDLLIRNAKGDDVLVLDTKWKMLDGARSSGSKKYGLSQSDFYQLYAYGQTYLNGRGDVVLIYPRTDAFNMPLEAFQFLKTDVLRLWVLPFCLQTRKLSVPLEAPFASMLAT